jgi:hypothetical protein
LKKQLEQKELLNFESIENFEEPEVVVPSSRRKDESYKTAHYWSLPENVRNAIDIAKMKSKHSEFFYKLQTLNDKIYVFRKIFYSKMPRHDKVFLQKKQEAL